MSMEFRLTIDNLPIDAQFEDVTDSLQGVVDAIRLRSFLPIDPYTAEVRDAHGDAVGKWGFVETEARP